MCALAEPCGALNVFNARTPIRLQPLLSVVAAPPVTADKCETAWLQKMGRFMGDDDQYIREQIVSDRTRGSDPAAAEVKKRYFAEELVVLAGDGNSVTLEFVTSKGELVGVICGAPMIRQLHDRIEQVLVGHQ